jgi:hypothetical protein
MKDSQLISGVRLIFGFLRGLSACSIVLVPVLLLVPNTTLSFKSLPFKTNVTVIAKTGPSAKEREAQIVELTGELKLKTKSDEDRAVYRMIFLVPSLVLMLFSFGLFHVIWRVCCNVENGDVFSLTNVELIRNMGILLIGYSLTSFLVGLWMRSRAMQYVRENFGFNGLEFQPSSSDLELSTSFLRLGSSPLVIGLLVLCLAEVFRQGLKLKQEAELTV